MKGTNISYWYLQLLSWMYEMPAFAPYWIMFSRDSFFFFIWTSNWQYKILLFKHD